MELSKIQNIFMAMLKEMKRNMESSLAERQTATKEIVAQMMAELTKGQDKPLTAITPEQIVDAVIHTVDGAELDSDKLAEFRIGALSLFEELPRAAHEQ